MNFTIRDIRKMFFNKRVYDIEEIFEFVGEQKVRVEIEKGVVIRIVPHLFNSLIWGKSIATTPEKMRDFSDIDYYNKATSAFAAFYSDLLLHKDYERIMEFDKWLRSFDLTAKTSINSQGKWLVDFDHKGICHG